MIFENRPGKDLVFGEVTLKNEPNALSDAVAVISGSIWW